MSSVLHAEEFSVVIEIPMNSEPIKYEIKDGKVTVDRVINVSMRYPCNYGFIPGTLGGDGDPLDALVLFNYPIMPSARINCRAIGVLAMEDESGMDEKIIAAPISKVDSSYDSISDVNDLPNLLKSKIKHFFEHYKDLEKNKWVKIIDWKNKNFAKELIVNSMV